MNPLTKASVTLLVLFLLSPLTASAANTSVLKVRKQEKMKCSLPEETMKSVIALAGETRGWTILEQSPGKTHVQYIKGRRNKHVLRLNVFYTENTFKVRYESSEGLDYYVVDQKTASHRLGQPGTRRVHSAVMNWMKNLNQDIKKEAKLTCKDLKARQDR